MQIWGMTAAEGVYLAAEKGGAIHSGTPALRLIAAVVVVVLVVAVVVAGHGDRGHGVVGPGLVSVVLFFEYA